MKIIETNLKFNNTLSKRKKTTHIVLHHSASKEAYASLVHQWHIGRGWSGIGYHFIVRKNGTIERGRPIDTVGAHCSNHNSYTIGICFEGNFQEEQMSNIQIQAGRELIAYVQALYGGNLKVVRHRDLMATACPGDNFPFDLMLSDVNFEEIEEAKISTDSKIDGVEGTLNNLDFDTRLVPAKHHMNAARGWWVTNHDTYLATGRNNFSEMIVTIPKGAKVYSAGYYNTVGINCFLCVSYNNTVGYVWRKYITKEK